MTKRKLLGISTFFTLAMLVYMTISTLSLKKAADSGVETGVAGITEAVTALALAVIFILFAFATVALLIAFILKLIATKINHNLFTFLILLWDILIAMFFAAILYDAIDTITKENIMEYIGTLSLVLVSALTVLLDVFSFPAKRKG